MSKKTRIVTLLDRSVLTRALLDSIRKLAPLDQLRNPVMFVVYAGSLLTTVLFSQSLTGTGQEPPGFILAITLWLWFTVLFSNFAEAVAEGRSKAQAASLRDAKRDIIAKKLDKPGSGANYRNVPGSS
ncbi:MAG: potassium-transporting ATPase subunit B, partial [Methylococcaceae bacterium]|nr:potassium-transporting ATPase subunit B [Methylococcaceae bacterium]